MIEVRISRSKYHSSVRNVRRVQTAVKQNNVAGALPCPQYTPIPKGYPPYIHN